MITDKIQELASTRAKLAALEALVAKELKAELAALPARYGFSDTGSFLDAVRSAAGKKRGRKPGRPAGTTKPATGKRRRTSITPEIRATVKKMVGEGKTGGEIAKATGISLPSVHNVKKALGLVTPRKS